MAPGTTPTTSKKMVPPAVISPATLPASVTTPALSPLTTARTRSHSGADTPDYDSRHATDKECDSRITGKTFRRVCACDHRSRLRTDLTVWPAPP